VIRVIGLDGPGRGFTTAVCLDGSSQFGHLIPGLGAFPIRVLTQQIGIAEESDVLRGIGQAVQCALIRKSIHCRAKETVRLHSQINLCHQTVGDQFAQPVMGTDEDIRAFSGRTSNFHLVADVPKP